MKLQISKRADKVEIYPSKINKGEWELIAWDIGGSPTDRITIIKEADICERCANPQKGKLICCHTYDPDKIECQYFKEA